MTKERLQCKNIWVYLEQDHGQLEKTGLELFTPARALADAYHEDVVAVLIGGQITSALIACAASQGADTVIAVEGSGYEEYHTEVFTDAFCILAEKYRPNTILIGASDNGRDLAPRVAARLKTGLTADCIDIKAGDEKVTRFICPAFGGNLLATIVCPQRRPQMATVRAGVFHRMEENKRECTVIRETVPQKSSRTALVRSVRKEQEGNCGLEKAKIIVAGGRGMGGAKQFELIRELAGEMGGAAASSRPPTDLGWISHEHMVGQTGASIKADIYIACGISGAIQHMTGVSSAKTVIAINTDPNAPIFKTADYGIVGDAMEIIPALLKELRNRKNKE